MSATIIYWLGVAAVWFCVVPGLLGIGCFAWVWALDQALGAFRMSRWVVMFAWNYSEFSEWRTEAKEKGRRVRGG